MTEEKVIDEVTQEPNNAQILMLSIYRPIYDIEVVDEKQNIWKGVPVSFQGMKTKNAFVFFSRLYQPEINDYDRIYPEIEMTDLDIIGIPFFLIPNEKLLFGYEPKTDSIVLPEPQIIKGRFGPN